MAVQNLGQWLARYLHHLRHERRLAANTLKSYQRDLQQVVSWCDIEGISCWEQLDPRQLRVYVSRRHRQGLSGKSLQRELSALRGLYCYLLREGVVQGNPAQGLRAPKNRRKLPVTMDVDQLAGLLDVDTSAPLDIRDLAMMELFYSSGLRLAELVSLNLDDVSRQDDTLQVIGKGSKTRRIPVGSKARGALDRWLKLRPELAAIGEQALFVSQRGGRIHPRTVQTRLKHWGQLSRSLPGNSSTYVAPFVCQPFVGIVG